MVIAWPAQCTERLNLARRLKRLPTPGLEACHKYIRRYREQLARKTSFEDNYKDVYIRLLAQSDVFSLSQIKLIGTKRIKKSLKRTSQHEQLISSLVIL